MQEFFTVSQTNEYIGLLMASDDLLQNCSVKGEISGYRLYQQSGHMYFTLKDANSVLSCVMFKSRTHLLRFKPEDGMEVNVRGSISVFSRQGKYQLYVEDMQPGGAGALLLYLEKLKDSLTQQGYFAAETKRVIPAMVNRVGIVTSRDGAALWDMIRILRQRHASVEVIVVHTSVQGMEAPGEIAAAIRLLNEHAYVEVIIVGRGGGSIEDLMAFNSEEVVKAIHESNLPVITGVGHEVDFTLADLAADLRAATPTQAAQLAVPDLTALQREISNFTRRINRSVTRKILYHTEVIDRIMMKKIWKQSGEILNHQREKLQEISERLTRDIIFIIRDKQVCCQHAMVALDSLSPMKVLARGYAVVKNGGTVIRNTNDIDVNDRLTISMIDAEIEVEVTNKENVKRWKT